MISAKQKPQPQTDTLCVGLFSKMEAALKISEGIRHLHSTVLGLQDACVVNTQQLQKGVKAQYTWEINSFDKLDYFENSSDRHSIIQNIIETTQFGKTLQNRNRLQCVAEELLTNAFYHAYKSSQGQEKYLRQNPAQLTQPEAIGIGFKENKEGLHLVVEDHGGSLMFANLASCFSRCYAPKGQRELIEQKGSGAGLGLFMIFENVTHLHMRVSPNQRTLISCWLSNMSSFDPDNFSFNFFEESSK
ncbi:MAG: hypothetical protein EB078_00185 [Proteobacteria bacterium]|nr:hypothetical protein [Pseudomonadota bacterium]NDD03298.1 hypothetical protein [Pseudomonadota bacterium]NDG27376.1 hypothetical protein [Pseudomonadota bacterium]